MYLAVVPAPRRAHTKEVALHYGISTSHLQKTVLKLVRLGYVEAMPGRNGGVRLARSADSVRIGTLVSEVEGLGHLVDCGRDPCPLTGHCILKCVLDDAERAFIDELNKKTLNDVVASPTGAALRRMIAECVAQRPGPSPRATPAPRDL